VTKPEAARPGPDLAARHVARHAGAVGAATLLSRLLGLLRDQVMAALFGAGFASDAFNTAFRVPNLLRDLFAEGAMSASFIPTFTEYDQKRGAAEAWALGRQLMMTLLAVLLVLCAVGWFFTPQFMAALAGGFARYPGKLELTGALFRIMLPFLPFVALAAAAMGMLNARGVFGVPALAPALLNVGMIVFGLALIPVCRHFGQPPIMAMAIGVVLGALLQFAVQLPALHRQGFSFRLEWPTWHPGGGVRGHAAGERLELLVPFHGEVHLVAAGEQADRREPLQFARVEQQRAAVLRRPDALRAQAAAHGRFLAGALLALEHRDRGQLEVGKQVAGIHDLRDARLEPSKVQFLAHVSSAVGGPAQRDRRGARNPSAAF
jgi:hypothetical protein